MKVTHDSGHMCSQLGTESSQLVTLVKYYKLFIFECVITF